ncbi:hypothetical protein D7X74_31715 [Corallococcus sp. CA047B]|uniref:immunity 49 family protein n=1 Tax=Corallococcus sp. CA047B TaxID=2316729 RepID=UPI000EA2AD30|nr:immunity 49 family protein [Corallococcus sp. CA047B]RKH08384.1 hypothetical protein D7X74_31715 [Corallococcus sp. CA047B]
MSHDYVEIARHNQSLILAETLEALAQSHAPPAELFSNAAVCYRVLALCTLLQEADTEGFAGLLCKAGQARLAFLELASQGTRRYEPGFLLASDNCGFSDALASGDLDTARAIARLSPARHGQDLEYEEDFLFTRFLHLWVLAPRDTAGLELALERWASVVEEGDPDTRLSACRALMEKSPDRFSLALQALVTERKREYRAYRKQLDFDEEVAATTGKVYLDGLALLRLAELEGLGPLPAYELLPELARIPLGTPLPGPQAWRVG